MASALGTYVILSGWLCDVHGQRQTVSRVIPGLTAFIPPGQIEFFLEVGPHASEPPPGLWSSEVNEYATRWTSMEG